jgi:hypothetical protein
VHKLPNLVNLDNADDFQSSELVGTSASDNLKAFETKRPGEALPASIELGSQRPGSRFANYKSDLYDLIIAILKSDIQQILLAT